MQIVLDIKVLTFFGNMIRQKDTFEHQIICRQLAIKEESSASFTITIRKTLQKYNLPDAYQLVNNMPSKEKMEVNGE